MAYKQNRAKSVGPHRFERFRAVLDAYADAANPSTAAHRQAYLDIFDSEVRAYYQRHAAEISVVTGALRRTLTASSDSGRVIAFSGRVITIAIKHPGAYYYGAPKVMPKIPLGIIGADATRKFVEWERRQ